MNANIVEANMVETAIAEDYKVLARKYRPQTFNDLVGQEVLVRTLSNAIDSNRLAHAFVLTGIRGIGKTTTARIIAKALNCIGEDGLRTTPTINPCGICSHCVQIKEDRHIDVHEIDAASNTGVDNVRDLTESTHYKPASGRYKVYIIDEAHMLSKQAFNALLKTLEEPADNVVFIFATTELRKIPVTILSRCQRFDLRRLRAEEMVTHLRNIASKEQVIAEDDALELIAIASEGSVRDALSLLDQAISHSDKDSAGNFHVKGETLRNLLGLVDRTRMYEMLNHIFAGNVAEALQELQFYHQAGADMLQLVQDLMHAIHDITKLLVMPKYTFDNTYSEGEKKFLYEMAGKLNVAATSQSWQIMSKGLEEVRRANDELRATEMLLIRVCYGMQMPDPSDLMKIIRGENVSAEVVKSDILKGEMKAELPISPVSDISQLNNVGLLPPQVVSHSQLQAQVLEFPKVAASANISQDNIMQDNVAQANIVQDNIAKPNNHAQIDDFTSIIELCEAEKEMILREVLRNNCSVISCGDGELIISDKSDFPRDLQAKLQALLLQKTGNNWQIITKSLQGQPTIAEQMQQVKHIEMQQAMQHEVVAAVFENFVDSQLVAIK